MVSGRKWRWLAGCASAVMCLVSMTPGGVQWVGLSRAARLVCDSPQKKAVVYGTPDIAAVPALSKVIIRPDAGGLHVSVFFKHPIAFATEGVLIAWQVFVFKHRADALKTIGDAILTFEDRGQGWEPAGWTMDVSSAQGTSQRLSETIGISPDHQELSVFFPPGFVDLQPPFYWFATQYAMRAYLPVKNKPNHQDWNVNGTVSMDCPAGVRAGPFSFANPNLLLEA
jgi:hypothetical protein